MSTPMRWLLTTCVLLAAAVASFAEAPDYDGTVEDFRRLLARLVAADTTNPPGNEARAVSAMTPVPEGASAAIALRRGRDI